MDELKRVTVMIYKATNTVTGVCAHIAAKDATEACKALGWDIGETYITVLEPRYTATQKRHGSFLYAVPCDVCPFQYAQCSRPKDRDCQVPHQAPELTEWLKQVSLAHLCPYVGESLDKEDYEKHKCWLPLESALALLAQQG